MTYIKVNDLLKHKTFNPPPNTLIVTVWTIRSNIWFLTIKEGSVCFSNANTP